MTTGPGPSMAPLVSLRGSASSTAFTTRRIPVSSFFFNHKAILLTILLVCTACSGVQAERYMVIRVADRDKEPQGVGATGIVQRLMND